MPHTKFVDAAAPPPHVGLSIRGPSEATTRARSSQVAVYIVVFILLAQLGFGLYSRSLAMAVPPCLLLCLIRRVVSSTSTDPSHHLIYHNGSNPSWSTALTLKYSTSDIIGLFPGFEPADYNVPTYFLNQSLARDGFAGGWVEPLTNRRDDPTTLQFRVGSPTEDIAAFTAMVDKFFTVAKTGLANYNATFTLTNPAPAGWSFCLPWGCPLAKYECVQLLHFPPSDSKTYYDYLYAKTVSRWDALLMNNGLAPERVALQDRIVDIIPIAAPANDGDKLDVYAQDFAEYALQMLQVMLVGTGAGDYTLPVIASGEPVRHWLSLIFKKQVEEQFPQGLNVGNLLFLRIEGVERTVPVLIANHPSYYLYCRHLKEKIIVMRQDLISSRWNVQMVSQSQPDPATVLAEAVAAFASDDVILPFVEQQDVLFGYHAENHPYGPSE